MFDSETDDAVTVRCIQDPCQAPYGQRV